MALPASSLLSGNSTLRLLLKGLNNPRHVKLSTSSQKSSSASSGKYMWPMVGAGVSVAGALLYALDNRVRASGGTLQAPALPWYHNGILNSLDHASVRRGYQVYKQVCSACHSMNNMTYRRLVGVSHTEQEVKQEAAEVQVEDGPNDDGNMFKRSGKLFDTFPNPYANDKAARAANNGALPPDLSYIVLARNGGEDYLFSLLTGYCDPPAGVQIQEGQYYNPYFTGGAIGMAQALYSEIIEYDDGTPATQSQLAKDVCTFLKWSGEDEFDQRKIVFIEGMLVLSVLLFVSYYMKRHVWAPIKSRKIVFLSSKDKKK